MALEALVNHFGQQTKDQEERLPNHMDAKSATKVQGLVKF